jgi:hypothetical protein
MGAGAYLENADLIGANVSLIGMQRMRKKERALQ